MLTRYIERAVSSAFTIIVLLLIFHSGLNAEIESEGKIISIDSYLRYIPSRGVDAQSGKTGVTESDTECSYEFKVFDRLPVKFSLDNKYLGIENTTGVELPAHLVGLTMDIETALPFLNLNKTYLRLGISPSFYGEDWDFSTSSFRIPVRSLLIYKPNSQWTFLGGIAIYPDFENEVLPILGFIYKPNDKLTFNLIPKRPGISYLINDRITLFAEGGSSLDEFEVTRDNFKNVVLRYKEMHLGGGVKYKVNQFIQGSIQAGGMFNRSLKYRDNQGKVKIKDGLYTEFRIEIKM